MKNITFAAYKVAIAICAIVVAISCDSTYLGIDDVEKPVTPPQPGEKYAKFENMEYVAEFDTIIGELFTVEQKISGSYVTYEGKEEIGRKLFSETMNLDAKLLASPLTVYVPTKEELSEVSLVESSNDGGNSEETTKENGFTVTETKKNYEFLFNQKEKVNAATVWQMLSYADTTFAYARIKNVLYDKFDAKLNEEKSNADSTVYDITLHFNVEVKCDKKPAIDKVYVVDVPYTRIYKNGEMPDIVETKVENEEYIAEFDTKVNELFTVRQENSGDFVTYKNGEEIERENWYKDINLEALFVVNGVSYVDHEDKLAQVALTASSFDGDKVNTTEDGTFTTTSRALNYNFKFNEGESVKSATAYDALTYGDDAFVHSSIKAVSYDKFEAGKNEEKSNADSTVYDVVLYFEVEVAREEPSLAKTRAQKAIETYTVAVPYHRVLKHEDKVVDKRAEDVKRVILDASTEEISWTEVEVWEHAGEKSTPISFKLYRHWNNPALQWVYTSNINYTTSGNGSSKIKDDSENQGNWTVKTRYMQYTSTANNGEKPFKNIYLYDYQSAVYANEFYTLNFDFANWTINEAESTISTMSTEVEKDGVVYNVFDYVNNVNTVYAIEGDSFEGSDKAEAKIATKDKVVGKRAEDVKRVILDASTEEISWTEVESWEYAGEKSNPISFKLYRHWNNPALQWVYTANTQYQTNSNGSSKIKDDSEKQGNWSVTTRYMQYTSTASNGVNPFNNVYSYDYQSAVYTDKFYTLNFDFANWTVNEVNSVVSTMPTEMEKDGIVYNVYDYVNNVSTLYAIEGDSYNGSDKAEAKIATEKPVDPVLPKDWGKILGAGISAVPSDDISGNFAKKCLTIRTEKGAVAVIFDYNGNVPSVSGILGSYFVTGTFGADYNSGYYTTSTNKGPYSVAKWAPAIAQDSNGITYFRDQTPVRNVRASTLALWNWANTHDGHASTVVSGYSFDVNNSTGVLTIRYNGKIVMRLL